MRLGTTSGFFSISVVRAPIVPGCSLTSSSRNNTYLVSLCIFSTPIFTKQKPKAHKLSKSQGMNNINEKRTLEDNLALHGCDYSLAKNSYKEEMKILREQKKKRIKSAPKIIHTNWLWIFWLQVVDKPATTTLASTWSCAHLGIDMSIVKLIHTSRRKKAISTMNWHYKRPERYVETCLYLVHR